MLPIGGLKEKLLAALRGGITKVLIPAENEKDLAEIPANIKDGLEIVPVTHVDEVLSHALATPVVPIDWTEADELAALPPSELAPAPDDAPGRFDPPLSRLVTATSARFSAERRRFPFDSCPAPGL